MVSARGHPLSIELTNENMELLQSDPQPDPDSEEVTAPPFRPTITHANVKWNATRKMVYCMYFDVEKDQLSRKSFRVVPGMDPVEFQRKVDTAAQSAANFYALNHHQTPAISNGTPAIRNGSSEAVDGALGPI